MSWRYRTGITLSIKKKKGRYDYLDSLQFGVKEIRRAKSGVIKGTHITSRHESVRAICAKKNKLRWIIWSSSLQKKASPRTNG